MGFGNVQVILCTSLHANVSCSMIVNVKSHQQMVEGGDFFIGGGTNGQRWKLCRKLGRSFPVGLGTSSRILRGSPTVFVLSRNFAVTYAVFGYFWDNIVLLSTVLAHFWLFLDLF